MRRSASTASESGTNLNALLLIGSIRWLDFPAFCMAFGNAHGRPFDLVPDPVLVSWLHHPGVVDDPGLYPGVFRLGGMEREDRRAAPGAKAALNLFAAAAQIFVASQLCGRSHLKVLAFNPDPDVERATIGPPTILAVAVIRWANRPGIAEGNSPA
jgi:hypothetical protein